MKRKIALFAAVLTSAAIFTPCIAFAETDFDVSAENIAVISAAEETSYEVAGGKVYINEAGVVTGCDSTVKVVDLEALAEENKIAIKGIGENAFMRHLELTKVVMPKGVTTIGDYAFSYCSGLTEIVIPKGVTTIGVGAFSYCSGLTSIEIPEGVITIGDLAFYDCKGLKKIVMPNSLIKMGNSIFEGCDSVKYAEVPNGYVNPNGYVSRVGLGNVENLKRIIDYDFVEIKYYDEKNKTFAVVVDTDVYGGNADKALYLDSVNVLANGISVRVTNCYYTDDTKKYIRFDVKYTNNSAVDYVRGEVVIKDANENDICYVSERQDIV